MLLSQRPPSPNTAFLRWISKVASNTSDFEGIEVKSNVKAVLALLITSRPQQVYMPIKDDVLVSNHLYFLLPAVFDIRDTSLQE